MGSSLCPNANSASTVPQGEQIHLYPRALRSFYRDRLKGIKMFMILHIMAAITLTKSWSDCCHDIFLIAFSLTFDICSMATKDKGVRRNQYPGNRGSK
jgi:hypothetical protein